MILLAFKKIPTTVPNSKNHFKELAAAFKKLSKAQKIVLNAACAPQTCSENREEKTSL